MVALFDNVTPFPVKQKDNEWFTPHQYVEAAREVMGGMIDLDPASCALANETVKAKRYYTKEDNGLLQDWTCSSMWLNPPYGRLTDTGRQTSWQGAFIKKLLAERELGNVKQAMLLLLGNSCFTRYFSALWDYPLCFFNGSLVFYRVGGKREDFGFGTIFVYLGPNEQKFIEVFSQFGRIAKAIDVPRKEHHTPLPLWEAL